MQKITLLIIGFFLFLYLLTGCKRGINQYVDSVELESRSGFKKEMEALFAQNDFFEGTRYKIMATGFEAKGTGKVLLKLTNPKFTENADYNSIEYLNQKIAKTLWQKVTNKDQYTAVQIVFYPEYYPTFPDGKNTLTYRTYPISSL